MRLTENFNLDEFHCKDGTPVPNELIPNVLELCKNSLTADNLFNCHWYIKNILK